MGVPLFFDDAAIIVEPGGAEKARNVELIRQPIDAHRKVPFQFIDEVLRQIRVGALVVDVDGDGLWLGHGGPDRCSTVFQGSGDDPSRPWAAGGLALTSLVGFSTRAANR